MLKLRNRRTELPWPPGLETLKKALLGPRKARSSLSRATAPYDDTLFIALALVRFFDDASGPFRLSTPKLSIACQLSFVGGEAQRGALHDALEAVVNSNFPPPLTDPLQTQVITQVRVLTEALIDEKQFRYASWLAQPGRGGMPLRWNPALSGAVSLLKSRRAL